MASASAADPSLVNGTEVRAGAVAGMGIWRKRKVGMDNVRRLLKLHKATNMVAERAVYPRKTFRRWWRRWLRL